jgi:hypothetical protein
MEVSAACHLHSEWSYDASWSLAALSARFIGRGYRIMLMTEHDRGFSGARLAQYREACARASSSEMLLVPGIEYSDSSNRVHVLVWGPVPFLGEGLPTLEMLRAVTGANGIAVLAHPSRREAWKTFEPSWADHLLGIEIWNRKYDGWAPSETAPGLLGTTSAIPFVGLDFHTQRQSFPLAMALDFDGNISEETVLDCLRSRRCSARAFRRPLTQGPVHTAFPALRMADRIRRMGASVAKYARGRTR